MKKKFIIYSLSFGLFLGSCEKMVKIEPQNAISPNVALTTIGGYEGLMNSAYNRLIDFSYYGRDFTMLGDVLADNVYTELSVSNNRWVGQNSNVRGAHYDIWSIAYSAINDVNTVINTIDANIKDANAALRVKTLKAEAYALRAMLYFDLARVYGYEPTSVTAGGGFNLSVPLRLKYTAGLPEAEQIPRGTITDVYASIESDLNIAIPLFPAGAGLSKDRFRMNKGAAYALLGRTLLYEGKWAAAVTQFDNAMNTTNTTARLIATGGYVSGFKTTPNPESFFEVVINPNTQLGGVIGSNDALYSYTHPTGYNGFKTFGGQTVSDELYALFEVNDDRFKMMFKYGGTSPTPPLFNWADKYSGATGPYADNFKVIRFADVLLMKAEALAELGQYTDAATLVTQLRTNRNATITGIPTDATIKNYIQTERRRELFFEGQRWFDLKRRANGVTKPAKTAIGTISASDYRLLAGIPTSEVALGLIQNPNY
ncbi:SusD-like starch-binding protein associating with outer membrane [Pedobacter nutrimenti]|uniref:SusD-like starch-binding protein associating with outer membrane n=2 Tax=Pedobacter nutrimenti TaxID=1241337 RepID=A0A318ULS1_9SPHI|nr:SusD-like starch-binding protein associating with outer membrane [Pedobacter nutrimenti]